MLNRTAWAGARVGLLVAATCLITTIAAASMASAYETGYGPVQLVSMTDSAAAQCPTSDVGASITRGYAPEYPAVALQLGLEGDSVVTFSMGVDGSISEVKLAGTSGNRSFDRAAIAAVQKSRFAPAVHNCSRIGGVYGVRVVFQHPLETQSSSPALPIGGNGPIVKR